MDWKIVGGSSISKAEVHFDAYVLTGRIRGLARDLEVRAKDNFSGETALHLAAEYGHAGVVRILLDKGADIAAKDFWGFTALGIATRFGQLEVVKVLLHRNADFMGMNVEGTLMAHEIMKLGDFEVTQIIIGKNPKPDEVLGCSTLHFAASIGDLEMVKKIIADGKANVDVEDYEAMSALDMAASIAKRKGYHEIVRILEDARAGPYEACGVGVK